jgi:hypothetical protein
MEPKRGRGRPPGSTNKPKAEPSLASGEEKILKRVDDLIDVVLDDAILNQNVKSATYLINRIYGRPTEKSEITTKGEQTIKVEYVDDWRNQ